MSCRSVRFMGLSIVLVLTVFLSLTEAQVAPQSVAAKASANKSTWTAPRAGDGHPELQGFWTNNTATPLERPKELANRQFLTDQEVAAMKKKAAQLFGAGESDAAFGDTLFQTVLSNVNGTKSGFTSTDGGTGDYSSVWIVPRDWDNRTSLITDPPDGRMPALTPEGQKRREANQAISRRVPEGPEDRPLQERCITYGSPQLVAGYQSHYEIAQSPNAVVMMTEMIHDARVIPLDGHPHLPATMHQWLGDSRGHWEGDTLVVDTTNYKSRSFMSISSEKLHVVERLTRSGPETLNYQITIDDPDTWTKPWTLMIPLRRSDKPLLEYACSEGNYGMAGVLAGARAADQAASKESK